MDMLNYDDVKNKKPTFISMTSLTKEEFEILYEKFKDALDDYNNEKGYDSSKGGRKSKLKTDEDKLLFILNYMKSYPLQEEIGCLFGISQSQANYWIHELTAVLNLMLLNSEYAPKRTPKELVDKLKEENLPDLSIDGSERRINRPKNKEEQKKKYSGKKKTHTVKNNIIVGNDDREVKYLGETHEGKKHDKKICDEEKITCPKGSNLYGDTAFIGLEMEDVNIIIPKKKPIGKELTEAEKENNKSISSVRVIVENVISGIKRCRIVKDVFRNTKLHFDDLVMFLACGLHNFRNHQRHQSY